MATAPIDQTLMESASPGRTNPQITADCRQAGQPDFPKCADLRHFLSCPSPAFIDYDYYFCCLCKRIWQKSFFYQDWEPNWIVSSLEQIQLDRKKWLGDSGVDTFPENAFGGGMHGFEEWVMSLPAPVAAGTLA